MSVTALDCNVSSVRQKCLLYPIVVVVVLGNVQNMHGKRQSMIGFVFQSFRCILILLKKST